MGSATALVLSSAVGVLVGNTLYSFLPDHIIRMVAGGGFLIVGLLVLLERYSRACHYRRMQWVYNQAEWFKNIFLADLRPAQLDRALASGAKG